MESYYVFSDEAGVYSNNPSNSFLKSHRYYVRANVMIKVDDYSIYQEKIKALNNNYKIPINEEIKWSDPWRKIKKNPRNSFIENTTTNDLFSYLDSVFELANSIESIVIILTFSDNRSSNIANIDTMMFFHLQEAFQRINTELEGKGFAIFILDELPDDYSNKAKEMCHIIVEKGDIIQYSRLYSGILFEKSNYSAGIQLADYVAGIFNSFLKSTDSDKSNYEYAKSKFSTFIKPHLRKSNSGIIMGYGIREVTRDYELRKKIQKAISQLEDVEMKNNGGKNA